MTKPQLGELLFADPSLSQPTGQACADCHAERRAFIDPEGYSTSTGAVAGRFGPRNSPTILYAQYAPPLHRDPSGRFVGGLFWDGRVDTLEAQVEKPLLNPLEMNNPSKDSVVEAVRQGPYAARFRELFGPASLDDIDAGFARITEVLAAYERTPALAPFSSKYDRYLAGKAILTEAETRGLAVFEDPAQGNCASCHPSRPSDGHPPLFTNFTYANLGVPRYANNKYYRLSPDLNPNGDRYIDRGLGATVGDSAQDGLFRVPTLRNITQTAPYGHNGYFENLPHLLDFLNTRDIGSPTATGCPASATAPCAWPDPEVPATVDHDHVGHLGLAAASLDDLQAFLATLTDEP